MFLFSFCLFRQLIIIIYIFLIRTPFSQRILLSSHYCGRRRCHSRSTSGCLQQVWFKWKAGAEWQPSAVIFPSTAISGIPLGPNPLQILHPGCTAVEGTNPVYIWHLLVSGGLQKGTLGLWYRPLLQLGDEDPVLHQVPAVRSGNSPAGPGTVLWVQGHHYTQVHYMSPSTHKPCLCAMWRNIVKMIFQRYACCVRVIRLLCKQDLGNSSAQWTTAKDGSSRLLGIPQSVLTSWPFPACCHYFSRSPTKHAVLPSYKWLLVVYSQHILNRLKDINANINIRIHFKNGFH